MVVFGSYAYTQIPLTRDYNTISFVLERLEIGAAGPSTAIGDAIGISLKRLKDIKSKSNIIILLQMEKIIPEKYLLKLQLTLLQKKM